ncbi:MAG: dihydrodipicolinate synthase family protein [Gemmatimonadales bacterium]|nr:dihydrodipicolinate synthase family protein [Gemmatimonadales bacterium]
MTAAQWTGVMPAITTPFTVDGSVDHEFLSGHARRLIASGCTGLIPLGSLGEGATLTFDEKVAVLATCVASVGDRVPVIAGVASLSTDEATALARKAADVGCRGLMVLPPYVYQGDWRESRAHVTAVMSATPLSCLLYNNPIAYGTDFLPEHVRLLAQQCTNLHAVKESSGDIRRITAIRSLLGDRISILVGLDDAIVEGVAAGAVGWVAGLVNALPDESVMLFEHARAGRMREARELYEWFLPLLRLDTVPKFVQLIKLAQEEAGLGSERVRAPRLQLDGAEREMALATIGECLGSRPAGA